MPWERQRLLVCLIDGDAQPCERQCASVVKRELAVLPDLTLLLEELHKPG